MGFGMGFCCCGDNNPPPYYSGSSAYSVPRTLTCSTSAGSIPTYIWNVNRNAIWRQFLTGSVPNITHTPSGTNPFSGTHVLEASGGSSGGQTFSKNRGGIFMYVRTGNGTFLGNNATYGIDTYSCPITEVYATNGTAVLHLGYDTSGNVYLYADNNMSTTSSWCSGSLPSFTRQENWWAALNSGGPTTTSGTVSAGGAHPGVVSGTGPCCAATTDTLYSGTKNGSVGYGTVTDGVAFTFSAVTPTNFSLNSNNSNFNVIDYSASTPTSKSLFTASLTTGLTSSCFLTELGNISATFHDYYNAPSGFSTTGSGGITFNVTASATSFVNNGNGCKLQVGFNGGNYAVPCTGTSACTSYTPTGVGSGYNTNNTPWVIGYGYPGWGASFSGSLS